MDPRCGSDWSKHSVGAWLRTLRWTTLDEDEWPGSVHKFDRRVANVNDLILGRLVSRIDRTGYVEDMSGWLSTVCACLRPAQQLEEVAVSSEKLVPPSPDKTKRPDQPPLLSFALSRISEDSNETASPLPLNFARLSVVFPPSYHFLPSSPVSRLRRSFDLSGSKENTFWPRFSWPVCRPSDIKALARSYSDAKSVERHFAYAVETVAWNDAFVWSSVEEALKVYDKASLPRFFSFLLWGVGRRDFGVASAILNANFLLYLCAVVHVVRQGRSHLFLRGGEPRIGLGVAARLAARQACRSGSGKLGSAQLNEETAGLTFVFISLSFSLCR